MLELYGKPDTAADAPRLVLDLIGVPYRYLTVGEDVSESDYRNLNPAGTVPTVVDGDLVLVETIAILLHVADRNLAAGLLSPVGSDERAREYRWLAYIGCSLMAAFYRFFHAERMIDGADARAALEAGAIRDLSAIGARLESEVTDGWLVGDHLTIADVLLHVIAGWGSEIEGLAFGGARLAAYRARVAAAVTRPVG
jgi:glutathione S-transferase